MKGIVLNDAALASQVQKFTSDSTKLVSDSITAASKSGQFRTLYKSCLAFNSVITSMKSRRIKPPYSGLETIATRIPLLVELGQLSLVQVELRRFIELLFWSLYFTHHPVEWQHFLGERGKGYSRDHRSPIAFAAHRDLNAFIEYAREYMANEPSGIGISAINGLEQEKHLLNSATHAGSIARAPARNPPVSPYSENEVKKIALLARKVLSNAAILMASFDRSRFNKMPAGHRAYFDYLVGDVHRRQIRKGSFGVSILPGRVP